MKAAIFLGPEKMEVREVPRPGCGDGEILIRVGACAVCGTDVRIYYHGQRNVHPPHIIGHEIAGTIEELGTGVSGYDIGDRVILVTSVGCGKCKYCVRGYQNLCVDTRAIGYFYQGGFAEYMAVPREAVQQGSVLKIPGELSFEQASIIEPLSCCINGQDYLKIEQGDVVAIFGAGPIGCMHTELARASGASETILIEVSPTRLDLARDFSPDLLIDAGREDPVERVLEITDGEGADVVVVACSSPRAQQQALQLTAKRGRISFFAGLPRGSSVVELDSNLIHYREISVFGAFASYREQYIRAMTLVSSGKVRAERFITHRFALDDIVKAIETTKSGVGLKAVIGNEAQG
ncbi:MAG TPA: alcohol dehydrogenase [Candidatus Latescibacteria bacterium]|nr:alcohol dehydrogenase [Candidatus Latescibacterota bacterium]